MVPQTMPISVYGGYKHVDAGAGSIFSTGSDEDIFFVGLKFYMNGSGAGRKRERPLRKR